MPVSIPTYLALRFVTKQGLQKRIKVLQKSYQYQVAGMSIFTLVNIDKVLITNNLIKIAPTPLI
tara:strand:+ start:290 stop:481 length:192 start_codon:yes stop_codon:yes gene_type:complete